MAVNTARVEKLRRRQVDGQALKRLVEAGLTWLRTNQDIVNSLNVFPVPDGDTGTNMVLTLQSAYDEIKDSGEKHLGRMAGLVAKGALMGARGNSGVILSQLWRGFARGVQDHASLDAETLVKAFAEARDTAYKGVVKPVEGTILTVARGIAEGTEAGLGSAEDAFDILETAVKAADETVEQTPELLPVLKQAGVVDSGGKGLFFILEGVLRHVYGESLDTPLASVQSLSAMNFENAMQEVEEGQDFEVVVDFFPNDGFELQPFYGRLEEMGTSIQVGEGEGMYRMHIHVPLDKRYEPIDYIMELGTITNVAMENLMAQMEDLQQSSAQQPIKFSDVEAGQIAVVTVSPGKGLTRIFASLGVAAVVAGGQTMNPSTQDILAAFENLPTNKVIILPNNKNIIMAANQAKDVTVKEVEVVPSRTLPQGLAAMLSLQPDGEVGPVAERMTKALSTVQTGEVTVAVRSVEIDGVHCSEGQVIALLDGKLVASSDSLEDACFRMLEKADASGHELITFYFGEDLPHAEANRIADLVREKYPEQEIEVQEGGQPHYQFIISVE
ncbi:MAG TPA: DAK2 domain-containing protein [Anaerolineales bacterium]|nr:DAK2 domain-containing protein [Anaerolineales bacterium]